jgi:hypothetical protein
MSGPRSLLRQPLSRRAVLRGALGGAAVGLALPPLEAMFSARAHGVGTEQCLRDYFRLSPAQAKPAIAQLVEDGELGLETVESIKDKAVAASKNLRTLRFMMTHASKIGKLSYLDLNNYYFDVYY